MLSTGVFSLRVRQWSPCGPASLCPQPRPLREGPAVGPGVSAAEAGPRSGLLEVTGFRAHLPPQQAAQSGASGRCDRDYNSLFPALLKSSPPRARRGSSPGALGVPLAEETVRRRESVGHNVAAPLHLVTGPRGHSLSPPLSVLVSSLSCRPCWPRGHGWSHNLDPRSSVPGRYACPFITTGQGPAKKHSSGQPGYYTRASPPLCAEQPTFPSRPQPFPLLRRWPLHRPAQSWQKGSTNGVAPVAFNSVKLML